MASSHIAPPPAITFETTAGIVQRHSDHTDSVAGPTWAARSKAHCRLMVPMSNDRRIQYLGTVGCDDDTIQRNCSELWANVIRA